MSKRKALKERFCEWGSEYLHMALYHFFHFITAFTQNPDFGVSCNYMA